MLITKELLKRKKKKIKIMLIPFYPLIYIWFFIAHILTPPIKRPGIHAVVGDTGAGKTVAVSIITEQLQKKYNTTVYSNSDFAPHVKVIDLFDYFGDFEIKKQLKNGIVVFDEIQRTFNKRLNRRNDYNEVFIPLAEFLATHRHNGIPAIYFITQSWDLLDIQLQSLIQKIHFITSTKRNDFKAWLRTDKIRPIIRPKRIKYFTRKRKDIKESDIQKYVKRKKLVYKKPKEFGITVELKHLVNFNTHAFKNKNNIGKKDKK